MDTVNVVNLSTGKVGTIPSRLYHSASFNRDDQFVLYQGSVQADCGCNGQTVPEEPDAEPEEPIIEEIED